MTPEHASFRDPSSRIFYQDGEVFRGLTDVALAHWKSLSETAVYKRLLQSGAIVGTELERRPDIKAEIPDQWAGILWHERIAFVTYPYEWTFGMLKDAALLHLDILEQAMNDGWTLKDGSAYNIQWRGHRPVFIDIASFEPCRAGESWAGYRQFCMMFLIPLLLKAHLNIDFTPLCRSNLEGIDPSEAAKFFQLSDIWRRGVFAHVLLHAFLQKRAARKEARRPPPSGSPREWPIKQTAAMTLGFVQSLNRMVAKLKCSAGNSTWSHYEETHSYDQDSFAAKTSFVARHVGQRRWSMVWDLACNTGTFAKLCSEHSGTVVAIDGDDGAVEKLYASLKGGKYNNILPVVMQLTNMSPDQGWRGRERKSFEKRGTPDLILCLAMIHHIVISAQVPLLEFLEWLRSFGAAVILEFVGPDDEMTQQLLRNRMGPLPDYTQERFEALARTMFDLGDSVPLKGGSRRLYFLEPKT